jgi:hypothetical protein
VALQLRGVSDDDRKYVVQLGSLRHVLSPNWIGLPGVVKESMVTLDVASLASVASQGVAVAWVPRPAVLAELLASTPADLIGVTLKRRDEIFDDCANALGRSSSGPIADVGTLLLTAIDTASAGYYPAAQALAANVLDTVLRIACPLGPWQGYRHVREAISELRDTGTVRHLRTGLALAPVLLATDTYDGTSNVVPTAYNRHATAHAVGGIQYSEANAVVALMAATSALRECQVAEPSKSRFL